MDLCDVAIIGAGPYGLSAGAHLRSIKGLEVRVFGETMSFWDRQMPEGMLLRSPWVASHLSDPESAFTLDDYRKKVGNHFGAPVPLERFVDYGRWFQRQAVPAVDNRAVENIEADPRGFALTLGDGSVLKSRRVVVAAGIAPFAARPDTFAGLPRSLVSHASEQKDLKRFAGKQVAVVGAGQSALESAVLLREGGAEVEVFVRDSVVHWLGQKPWLHKQPLKLMLYAPPDVGPAFISHLVARPNLFRCLPRDLQDRLGPRSIRPAGALWLMKRFDFQNTPIRTGLFVVKAQAQGDRLNLKMNDQSERMVDHVLLGTGYRVNISRYEFLSRKVLDRVNQVNGYPKLDEGFESTLPGLHFLGAPAAWSFGPLMRFVAGTEFVARGLARRVAKQR